jgi:hypothetical protein
LEKKEKSIRKNGPQGFAQNPIDSIRDTCDTKGLDPPNFKKSLNHCYEDKRETDMTYSVNQLDWQFD